MSDQRRQKKKQPDVSSPPPTSSKDSQQRAQSQGTQSSGKAKGDNQSQNNSSSQSKNQNTGQQARNSTSGQSKDKKTGQQPQGQKQGQNSNQDQEQQQQQALGLPEWITFGVGLAIVLGIIVFLTYLHVTGPKGPPRIQVIMHTEQVTHQTEGYYLPIEVRNSGGKTAEDVNVAVTLQTDQGQPETISYNIHFLPSDENKKATFLFQKDPTHGELSYLVNFKNPQGEGY